MWKNENNKLDYEKPKSDQRGEGGEQRKSSAIDVNLIVSFE